jgi:hypothetical protein
MRSLHIFFLSPFFLLIIACCLRAGQGGIGPGTPQELCGVAPGAEILKAQAVCIAKAFGFQPGIHPWNVIETIEPPSTAAWSIIITTVDGPTAGSQCGSLGVQVWIGKADGRIVRVSPWEIDCPK